MVESDPTAKRMGWILAGVTFFIPLQLVDESVDAKFLLGFTQRFLFVFVLMLPFEIRDMKYDSLKLSTIPQQIGIIKTKAIGLLLCLS